METGRRGDFEIAGVGGLSRRDGQESIWDHDTL